MDKLDKLVGVAERAGEGDRRLPQRRMKAIAHSEQRSPTYSLAYSSHGSGCADAREQNVLEARQLPLALDATASFMRRFPTLRVLALSLVRLPSASRLLACRTLAVGVQSAAYKMAVYREVIGCGGVCLTY